MSNDDRFFEKLRDDARELRFQPDDVMLSRIAARVRSDIASDATVTSLLARWFRPLAASFAAIALAATLGIALVDIPSETDVEERIEISMAGDAYSVGE